MDETGVEVWRGSVAAWECDTMGHLNVGFYAAKGMEAMVSLAAELGMPHAYAAHAESTIIPRELHIRFMREAHGGAGLRITGGVLEMGEDEALVLLLMLHNSGELAASFHLRVQHATARNGRAFPWPERVRARAEALKVTTPEKARPRSIPMGSLETGASLERANDLGLQRIALGAVRPGDCDPFGRMKAEQMISRISDGIPNLDGLRPVRPGARVGGVALEYRMIYLDWPRLGDRVEMRSAPAGGDARVRRVVHWCLDPTTGKAWGGAEAVAAAFDLDARKIITLSDEEMAAMADVVVEGLEL